MKFGLAALMAGVIMGLANFAPSVGASGAAGVCPSNTSLFGTVREVRGSDLLVQTTSGTGMEHFLINRAIVNSNGLTLHSGVFVGGWGCFTTGRKDFNVSELTLATSAATYPRGARHTQTLTGIVVSAEVPGMIEVQTGRPHGHVDVKTSEASMAKRGDRVTVTGSFNADGSFTAETISFTHPEIQTLTGTVVGIELPSMVEVQTIGPHGRVDVHTSDASAARKGDRITARGTFNADGSFVAASVSFSHTSTQTLTGTIVGVEPPGLIEVQTGRPHGQVDVHTTQAALAKKGEQVTIVGSFNADGSFTANSIVFTR